MIGFSIIASVNEFAIRAGSVTSLIDFFPLPEMLNDIALTNRSRAGSPRTEQRSAVNGIAEALLGLDRKKQ